MSEAQRRRQYFHRKFETGELVNGFPLLYAPTERPPPVDSIVNGRRTPTYMLCWKLVIDSDEVEGKYPCMVGNISNEITYPRWKELGYADRFGTEFLPRLTIADPYLLIILGVNLDDEYMAAIMRPELIAAAKEAYNISDTLPPHYDLKWRRMTI